MKNIKLHNILRDIFLSMSIDELNKINTLELLESIKTNLDEIIVLKSEKAVDKKINEKITTYMSIEDKLNELNLREIRNFFNSMGINELNKIISSKLLIEQRVELEKSLSEKRKTLEKMEASFSKSEQDNYKPTYYKEIKVHKKLDGTRDYRYKDNIEYK